MNNNIYNFKITTKMLLQISSIMEKIGALNSHIAINNNSSNWSVLLKKINPYNIEDFKKIRKIRFNDDSLINNNNYYFTYSKCINIAKLLSDLFDYINKNYTKIHPLILISIFHFNMIIINPFDKENEKIIKVWTELLLVKYNIIFEKFSLIELINNNIKEYQKAINNSYIQKDLTTFIEFILYLIDTKINSIIKKNTIITNKDININKLLNAMEKNKPMSAYEIMKKLNIKSKETFRNSYMDIAIKEGLVNRTIPNKPTSRNQMYYKI